MENSFPSSKIKPTHELGFIAPRVYETTYHRFQNEAHTSSQKNLTQPAGYDAIEKKFRKVRAAAGKSCSGLVMHGWRYTAAVELAEAGCSDAEIQSVTGHKTLAMVQKYRQRASQKQLSMQVQNRRDRT